MKSSWHTIRVFTEISTKRFFRDKMAIFFVIIFPLIFLFVFGSINSGSGGPSFDVSIDNQSETPIALDIVDTLSSSDIFDIKTETDPELLDELLSRGQLDAIIRLPKDFGAFERGTPTGQATVVYPPSQAQSGQVLVDILGSIFEAKNLEITGSPQPLSVVGEQTNTAGLSAFDYSFAGLLGFAIIGMGIFGPVNVFPELKKQGVLRRFHTTPLKVWEYFAANVFSQAIIGLVATLVMFVVALTIFNLNVVGNLFEVAFYVTLSVIMIYGIGLAIGGWAKNERQAAPLSNIIVFPMMFLSGTFFPRYVMPELMQTISNFLPLTPVIDGIRLLLNEGQTLVDISGYVLQLMVWIVVVYWIAFRVFRWE